MVFIIRSWRVLLALLFIQSAIALLPLNASRGADPVPSAALHKYSDEVAKFAAAPAPAPGGVLMVGSSIFRKWLSVTIKATPTPPPTPDYPAPSTSTPGRSRNI